MRNGIIIVLVKRINSALHIYPRCMRTTIISYARRTDGNHILCQWLLRHCQREFAQIIAPIWRVLIIQDCNTTTCWSSLLSKGCRIRFCNNFPNWNFTCTRIYLICRLCSPIARIGYSRAKRKSGNNVRCLIGGLEWYTYVGITSKTKVYCLCTADIRTHPQCPNRQSRRPFIHQDTIASFNIGRIRFISYSIFISDGVFDLIYITSWPADENIYIICTTLVSNRKINLGLHQHWYSRHEEKQ